MPSTYLSLHYHIIFSTKNRNPLIASAWRNRLHEYMGGTIRSLKEIPQTIGGVDDHVHLLLGLKATHCLSDFMRDLKKRTSLWVHETIREPRFEWQDGYAAFTISAPSRGAVVKYITNQEEHHRTMTFREELVKFLKRAVWSTMKNIWIDCASAGESSCTPAGVLVASGCVVRGCRAGARNPRLMSVTPAGVRRRSAWTFSISPRAAVSATRTLATPPEELRGRSGSQKWHSKNSKQVPEMEISRTKFLVCILAAIPPM